MHERARAGNGVAGATIGAAAQYERQRPVPLVCLHGLAGSSRWWRLVAEDLEQTGPVRFLDLPRAVHPSELAAWVASRIRDAGEPVDLVGHSLGGLAALRVAASEPSLVRKLILIAPPGMGPRGSPLRYCRPLLSTLMRSRPRFLMRMTSDVFRAGPRNIVRGGLYAASADPTVEAGQAQAPTLLVWGRHDQLVPTTTGELWLNVIPIAQLRVIENASHVPMIESPSELANAIRGVPTRTMRSAARRGRG